MSFGNTAPLSNLPANQPHFQYSQPQHQSTYQYNQISQPSVTNQSNLQSYYSHSTPSMRLVQQPTTIVKEPIVEKRIVYVDEQSSPQKVYGKSSEKKSRKSYRK